MCYSGLEVKSAKPTALAGSLIFLPAYRMNLFSELSLCPVLQCNVAKHGYIQPTPVQAGAIPPAIAGRDIVATAQTGTGKTLAFLLPILNAILTNAQQRGCVALVLSPTRELAIQINEAFVKLAAGTAIRSAVAVGGLSEGQQLRAIRGGAQVIIATPGRLSDFLERKIVSLSQVRTFVLDEADRMLDMGFLPTIRTITKALPVTRQTLLFSATIEQSVAHLIDSSVRNPVRVSIGSTAAPAERVDLRLYEVEQDRKLNLLTRLLHHEAGSFLVFARTKRSTDRLARNLQTAGVKAGRIHGDRTQGQRNQALAGFRDGTYRVLVATDVAARGIHVEGIAHVVNYDLPQVPEDFIHRVGRTGRAGARGIASTFSTRTERSEIRNIERALGVRLVPQEVSADVRREVKTRQVIDLPAAARGRSGDSFSPRRRGVAVRQSSTKSRANRETLRSFTARGRTLPPQSTT
jgi:ATP-dependent RNA helicase RhlE